MIDVVKKLIENQNKIEETKISEPPQIKDELKNIPLNSTWAFWYASRKEKDPHIPYSARLTTIAEFNNLKDFFKYYIYLKLVNN